MTDCIKPSTIHERGNCKINFEEWLGVCWKSARVVTFLFSVRLLLAKEKELLHKKKYCCLYYISFSFFAMYLSNYILYVVEAAGLHLRSWGACNDSSIQLRDEKVEN